MPGCVTVNCRILVIGILGLIFKSTGTAAAHGNVAGRIPVDVKTTYKAGLIDAEIVVVSRVPPGLVARFTISTYTAASFVHSLAAVFVDAV